MQQNVLVDDNSNQEESISKVEEEDNTNILNKSIAEIQSIINNISFFPQNKKGECVNNSDITSMSVDSNDKEQSKSSSSSKTTVKQSKSTAPPNQKLQLPPLVESQYNY
jgi:hypothetical protein